MLIIGLCILALTVLFAALGIAERSRRKRKQQRQEYGLTVLKSGLDLMAAIQQHRGMSIALLNGDTAFKSKMMLKRQEIQGILGKMPPVLSHTPELHPDEASLSAIIKGWEELVRTSEGQIPEKSFKQHTALVRAVIHLMGDMGEHLGLLDGEGTPLARLSNTLLLKLPLLLESIGQARALGSGYAARGQCGAVGRIRLSFLEQRIRECHEGVQSASAEDNAITKKVGALLDTLQSRFIEADHVDISPTLFFQTATDAIEACLALWKEIAQHTGAAVVNRA
ncbi:MAG TPA: hypothetical protein VGK14_14250 [Novimethylophilus sp.]|jgi:hypothetical protein|uniref:hypothetical protein n=1 Tax=Novimethylophilus sp. TaxID=2137426 RepID=UPI002F4180A4